MWRYLGYGSTTAIVLVTVNQLGFAFPETLQEPVLAFGGVVLFLILMTGLFGAIDIWKDAEGTPKSTDFLGVAGLVMIAFIAYLACVGGGLWLAS